METFAQFGSIFLLFGHGLTYSTFMNTGSLNSSVYAPQVMNLYGPSSIYAFVWLLDYDFVCLCVGQAFLLLTDSCSPAWTYTPTMYVFFL